MATKSVPWILLGGLMWLSACGDGGGGSSGSAPAPSSSEVASVQKAASAGNAADEMEDVGTHAVIDSGSSGATAKSAPARTAGVGFAYAGAVEIVIDLDATDPSGADLYPNATGVIVVKAAGAVVGDSSAGEVNYVVEVGVLAEATFKDEGTGNDVKVAVGAACAFGLKITWSYTDDLNWTVTGTVAGACTVAGIAINLSDGTTAAAVVNCEFLASCTISRTLGVYTGSCTVAGKKVIAVTDATGTHVVVIAFAAHDAITVDVDGTVYGPYDRVRLGIVFGIDVD